MQSNAIYEGAELRQRSNPDADHWSTDSTSSAPNQQQLDNFLAMPPTPVEVRFPKDTDQLPGRRTPRKPVPAYNESKLDLSPASDDNSLDRPDVLLPIARPNTDSILVTELCDKSVHYLIPDILPPGND
jgi:hypothetical protein